MCINSWEYLGEKRFCLQWLDFVYWVTKSSQSFLQMLYSALFFLAESHARCSTFSCLQVYFISICCKQDMSSITFLLYCVSVLSILQSVLKRKAGFHWCYWEVSSHLGENQDFNFQTFKANCFQSSQNDCSNNHLCDFFVKFLLREAISREVPPDVFFFTFV